MKNKKENLKTYIALHILLMIYSFGTVCSKFASEYEFLSLGFILCIGGLFLSMGIYALGWQQVIKKLPLTTAFANKAATVVWGIIWGILFFNEKISIKNVIGAILVMIGVILYARAGDDNADQ